VCVCVCVRVCVCVLVRARVCVCVCVSMRERGMCLHVSLFLTFVLSLLQNSPQAHAHTRHLLPQSILMRLIIIFLSLSLSLILFFLRARALCLSNTNLETYISTAHQPCSPHFLYLHFVGVCLPLSNTPYAHTQTHYTTKTSTTHQN